MTEARSEHPDVEEAARWVVANVATHARAHIVATAYLAERTRREKEAGDKELARDDARGSASSKPTASQRDIVDRLEVLTKQGEDYIWRPAVDAVAEIKRLRHILTAYQDGIRIANFLRQAGERNGHSPEVPVPKLWLWKNGDHHLAFDNLYPCYPGGDPMVLGEPSGFAIFKPSAPGPKAEGHAPVSASPCEPVPSLESPQ